MSDTAAPLVSVVAEDGNRPAAKDGPSAFELRDAAHGHYKRPTADRERIDTHPPAARLKIRHSLGCCKRYRQHHSIQTEKSAAPCVAAGKNWHLDFCLDRAECLFLNPDVLKSASFRIQIVTEI